MDNSIAEFLIAEGYEMRNGIFVNKTRPSPASHFEEAYLKARESEGRLYNPETVYELPFVPVSHPLAAEWLVRKKSAEKFGKYLHAKKINLKVLEIGCGNGWLTHYLAHKLPDCQFMGMDVNWVELKQAAKAFEGTANITWLFEEITNDAVLPDGYFDIIFFAAAIQYFPDLKILLTSVSKYLAPQGEIHILDSSFYNEKEVEEARQRTKDHYAGSAPEMADYYFHHSLENLYGSGFKVKKMNSTAPLSLLWKMDITGLWDYFGWYCLKR